MWKSAPENREGNLINAGCNTDELASIPSRKKLIPQVKAKRDLEEAVPARIANSLDWPTGIYPAVSKEVHLSRRVRMRGQPH